MNDMPFGSELITDRWPSPSDKDGRAGLRVLVLCEAAEPALRIAPEGPISLKVVHSWLDVTKALEAEHFEVLALETFSEDVLESGKVAEALRLSPDLHVALVGAEIDMNLARLALRKGVNGIVLNMADDVLDTPLRMVAEGKVYIDSSMAGQLLGEGGGLDQPLISLTDTIALVADDDEYFRMALSTILLEKFGFTEVFEASNLEQAEQIMAGCDRVDLALFDLRMPGMDGPSRLAHIRQTHPEIRKMAVVSASQDRNDVLQSLAAGTYGYVSKAEGISELKLAIGQILKGRIYAPALLHEPPEDPIAFIPHAEPDPATPEAVVLAFETGTEVATIAAAEELAEAARYVPEPDPKEAQETSEIPELSPRQRRVLELLVQGMSNKEIAREMNLGIGTVKVHMTALFTKLGVSNRTSAVAVGAPLLS